MGNPALDTLSFIIGTLFNIYALVVAVRFVMQATRADYYNPIAQSIVKITDPLLKPLRKIVPGVAGLDMASLVLCLLVIVAKFFLMRMLGIENVAAAGYLLPVGSMGLGKLLGLSLLDMLNLFFNIAIYSIVIMALLSWVVPDGNNPLYSLLQSLTNPILRRVRAVVPPLGGLDLSAFVAIIGLYALKILVMGTLMGTLFR